MPHLLRLHRETGMVVALAVPDGSDVLIVERLWGQDVQLRIIFQTGVRFPMYASALGHCMLAFQPPAIVEQVLERTRLEPLTPQTVVDPAALIERLRRVRERGFDIADEELFAGARAVAVAVTGASGSAIGGVALTGDSRSFSIDKLEHQIAPKVVEVGAAISIALGGRSYGGVLRSAGSQLAGL
jgi:IclR family pca regulon transcriptional regulator